MKKTLSITAVLVFAYVLREYLLVILPVAIMFALIYGAGRAITLASQEGYSGALGLLGWITESVSREAWSLHCALRRYDEGRRAGREEWMRRIWPAERSA